MALTDAEASLIPLSFPSAQTATTPTHIQTTTMALTRASLIPPHSQVPPIQAHTASITAPNPAKTTVTHTQSPTTTMLIHAQAAMGLIHTHTSIVCTRRKKLHTTEAHIKPHHQLDHHTQTHMMPAHVYTDMICTMHMDLQIAGAHQHQDRMCTPMVVIHAQITIIEPHHSLTKTSPIKEPRKPHGTEAYVQQHPHPDHTLTTSS
jgi:hypothetical protein